MSACFAGASESDLIVQATAARSLPGWPTSFAAGYPLLFVGIILLPHLRPGHFERIRLAIDAIAGTVSLAVVMWVAYLHRVVNVGSDSIETFLNLLYPFGDVLLATALMILAMRRSEQRLDLRVLSLPAPWLSTSRRCDLFPSGRRAETYVAWGWLDASGCAHKDSCLLPPGW